MNVNISYKFAIGIKSGTITGSYTIFTALNESQLRIMKCGMEHQLTENGRGVRTFYIYV